MTGSDARRRPRRYPRALLSAVYAVEAFCAGPLRGKARYARLLQRDRLRVREVEVHLPRLPAAFDGYRVLHLSDFHAGPFLDAASLEDVAAIARGLAPDLVCLTGDYITHRIEEGLGIAAVLARCAGRDGACAVFGNHDYRRRREGELEAAFANGGVRTLRNAGFAVERSGAGLFVAGIEDVEEGKVVDLDAALAGAGSGDAVILLAHHPEVVEQAAARGVDLVLSGHTHAGQVVIAGHSLLGAATRSRYRHGLYAVGETRLHVTSGIGVLILPLRIGAPPEIALLRLRRGGV